MKSETKVRGPAEEARPPLPTALYPDSSAPASERIRERHRRRPRLERLRLAFMRRPGCEPDEIEGRAQTPVRVGEALRVDGGGAQEDFATQRFAAARLQRVRGPHSAEVGEEREQVRVADGCAIEIDDRQR